MERLNKKAVQSVLFIIPDQFGYSAGYYYYCKYLLVAGYRVGVLCVDAGRERRDLDGEFSVYYIKSDNPIGYRIKWFSTARKLSKNYDIIILKQVFGLSLGLPFLSRRNTILDIRTGSVRKNKLQKSLENLELKLLINYFKRIFILSHELASEFKIPKTKYTWLPLGADEIALNEKNYVSSMNLLYVGTFAGRNINKSIDGFALFNKKYGALIDLTYDIIGDGPENEKQLIKEAINKNHLNNKVFLRGYLTHQAAKAYYEKCNIGVSYVPMLPCYDNQPPTKTYEYIISGLVCLGTATHSNTLIINDANGLLHLDNEMDFCCALEDYYKKRFTYSTNVVKSTLVDYKWENIVKGILIPSIKK